MSTRAVIVGSGYAGTGAVKKLEEVAGNSIDITWISEHEYHLVLHEVHRCIRDPSIESYVVIPVDEVKQPETEFIHDRVTNVDIDNQIVETDTQSDIAYDYLLLAVGSETAFYGIDGLQGHAHQLKGLDDAQEIHSDVKSAAESATQQNPAKIVIGGAGLSGIQTAGEIAEYRDAKRAPMEITLVEGLDEIFPGNDTELQTALRERLEEKGVNIMTGEFISGVDEDVIYIGGSEDQDPTQLAYDTLVWTGGITGQKEISNVDVSKDDRSARVETGADFQTSNPHVFAVGDTALIDQGEDQVAPPTAQAAWQAAEVAGENIARAATDRPLKTWYHDDKGTVISVGDEAVAHDVKFPVLGSFPVTVFGGPMARTLKKAIAARWIADVASTQRAMRAWSNM